MKEPGKVSLLLSAFAGAGNLGDDAIAEALIHELGRDFRLTLLTKTARGALRITASGRARGVRLSLVNFLRECRHADRFILGGGGIINDESSVLSLVRYWIQLVIARRLFRLPSYLLYVGVGPLTTRIGLLVAKDIVGMAEYSVVRDEQSFALMKRLGAQEEDMTLAFDAAFSLPVVPPMSMERNSGTVLFCPRDWFFLRRGAPTARSLRQAVGDPSSQLHEFRRSLLTLVVELLNRDPDARIVAAALYPTQDLPLLQWLKDQLPTHFSRRFDVVLGELTAEAFLRLASTSDVLLGMRMHSLVLGSLAGVPLAPLSYSTKVDSLAGALGLLPTTTRLESPCLDVQTVADRVDEARAAPTDLTVLLAQIRSHNADVIGQFKRRLAPNRPTG